MFPEANCFIIIVNLQAVFINTGSATAADFLELAGMVRKEIRDRYGVELEEEVQIVGAG